MPTIEVPHHRPKILAFSTLGAGSNEEARIRDLLAAFEPEVFPYDRKAKRNSFLGLLKTIFSRRPDLVVLEGTGIGGGFALLIGRFFGGIPYVVSSGDAVGPWVGQQYRLLGPVFGLYERILCGYAAGFIGWTPYLAGRALTFGVPRAMTAAGWAPFPLALDDAAEVRQSVRNRLGIPEKALVVGIAGSLAWNRRFRYCYGWELVKAVKDVARSDVHVLIVGDGTGLQHLKQLAGEKANRLVHFTGRVPQKEIPAYLAAMDIGSLPQSVDGVGSFRYTTKISEYLAAGLPLVTGQLPFAYDLGDDWLWRLPGAALGLPCIRKL